MRMCICAAALLRAHGEFDVGQHVVPYVFFFGFFYYTIHACVSASVRMLRMSVYVC